MSSFFICLNLYVLTTQYQLEKIIDIVIQTRKQELSEKEYNELSEVEKRLYRRNQARKGNFNLNQTAINSGVKNLARFHNAGYKGLYNGETADDILKKTKI